MNDPNPIDFVISIFLLIIAYHMFRTSRRWMRQGRRAIQLQEIPDNDFWWKAYKDEDPKKMGKNFIMFSFIIMMMGFVPATVAVAIIISILEVIIR